ncbi:MAG: hypothetical protein QXT16_07630 [Candidatus Caldarchaeum sp.]
MSGAVSVLLGFVGFLSMAVASILTPLLSCFCCSPLGGMIAGFAACELDRKSFEKKERTGAKAGALYGIGGLLGTYVGIAINMIYAMESGASAEIARLLGLPEPTSILHYALGFILLASVAFPVIIGITAGFGALGGVLWKSLRKSTQDSYASF